ncbi:cob(I)yrinic acid a,c-diamide adenosyltransferase [Chloroflexota bacterium]
MEQRGLVQVFTGNGKGKSTATFGTVLRAVGHGLKSHIVFFMKGDYPYGEYNSLRNLPGVSIDIYGYPKLIDPANIKPEEYEQAGAALTAARKAVSSGDYDIVVLEEVNVAIAMDMIKLEDILEIIKNKPAQTELILTGRYAKTELLEVADLVTEMVKVKHPYDAGVKARRGIEF